MAIYFPELYCPKGTVLKAIKQIVFKDFSINMEQECYVYDVKEYGFDIHPLWDKTKVFRINNSQMKNYFTILITPEREGLSIDLPDYKVRFKKGFKVGNYEEIKEGEEFYFMIDSRLENQVKKTYYDLYNSQRRVLRLNQTEASELLEF